MRTLSNIFFAVSIPFFFVSGIFAQPPDTLWTKTYGGTANDYGYCVQQISDGRYIITGRTYSFGAGNYDVYLVKTDSTGDTLWTRTYGGLYNDYGQSVQQTTDGGYIIAGRTRSYSSSYDVFLVKTDSMGNTTWTKTYGDSADNYGYSVEQTADNGYIITGWAQVYGTGYTDVYLVKTDSIGDTLWTRRYGASNYDYGYAVSQTSDNGYVVAGITRGYGYDAYLVKTNSSGDTLWTKTYSFGAYHEYAHSVQQTQDGGYIIAGWIDSSGTGENAAYLIKTDSGGNVVWEKTYGRQGGHTLARSVQELTFGSNPIGYIVAGTFCNSLSGNHDVYLLRVNNSGDTLWSKTIGGIADDYGYFAQQTNDWAYIIAGYTNSYGAGNNDFYLIKTKPPLGIKRPDFNNDENGKPSLTAYFSVPSFFINNIRIRFMHHPKAQLKVKIFNIYGSTVFEKSLSNTPSSILLDGKKIKQLSRGIYFLSVSSETKRLGPVKIIKM